MPYVTITGTSINPDGPGRAFSAANTDVLVAQSALVGSQNSFGLAALASNHDITVLGTVSGATFGLRLGDALTDASNDLRVMQLATISGAHVGVAFTGTGGSILNNGNIVGGEAGLTIRGRGAVEVVNRYGTIAGDVGIEVNPAGTAAVTVINSGAIVGTVLAYQGGAGVDRLINQGDIVGDVRLGAGNDTFDASNGGRIVGVVKGGDGNDVFLLNYGTGTYDGGAGIDTLDFRAGSYVRVVMGDVDQDANTYTGFERILGSAGSDVFFGDALANTLVGRAGEDKLVGGGGADSIEGGRGRDTMTGGAGNDSFVYRAPDLRGEGYSDFDQADQIRDFGFTTGDNDRFVISAAGFGGNLALGTLPESRFVVQTSSSPAEALDPNDRFIYRTTDQTLYFDVDGSGAEGPVLIADLSSGPLTAADIFIVA